MRDHPAYLFLGENAVCPDCVIHKISKNSRFINSKLVDLFFNALLDVLSCSPICRKRQRNK